MAKFTNRVKNRLMAASRKKKLEHFYRAYDGGRILDVGVSGKTKHGAGNLFLKTFRLEDSLYTGLGIQDLTEVAAENPGKRFVRYSGGLFPFGDKEFDWVFSNAVIEHVGDDDAQLFFVNEMLRVARNVFFTTPNKYFPIEPHTNVPLLHWHNPTFYRWCARNRPWTTRDNLYLFSARRLKALMERSEAREYSMVSGRLLGWPMTFTVVCRGQ